MKGVKKFLVLILTKSMISNEKLFHKLFQKVSGHSPDYKKIEFIKIHTTIFEARIVTYTLTHSNLIQNGIHTGIRDSGQQRLGFQGQDFTTGAP